ncbi:Inner membrane protein YrbG [Anatilimnocola aggregata]|uniref:Inner membrane protein YrbG n=1 Tax=Anatilimnocola aggregata TaxID=2528021 RepID=A0A517YGR6_9BACT|nr:sodium:calcium antiporter [Anatilimnocola aggregata]QDU29423.1 Inner membrane protein YrbG [Anatilimnocola aggregata]
MLVPILQFLVCAAVIVVAGTFLSKFADAIAELTGLGRLLVGSVLLAGATSLPELTVDISAVRMGAVDLAVGDLIGSCLMNLLILAILDLSHHSNGRMLSKQAAAHALSGSVSASLICLVALGLLTSKWISPYAMMGLSPVIIAIVVAYILGVRLVYLDQRIAHRTAVDEGAKPHEVGANLSLGNAVAGFVACAGVILIAGPFLAHAADALATESGLGGTFVGTTLVAFSTSLPELVASLAALRMGAHDLAIGNVFGSNAFNMLLLAPLEVIQPGSLFSAVSPNHAITCVATLLATQVAVMGQLYQVEKRTRLIEPDALLVILIVFGALGLVYFCR